MPTITFSCLTSKRQKCLFLEERGMNAKATFFSKRLILFRSRFKTILKEWVFQINGASSKISGSRGTMRFPCDNEGMWTAMVVSQRPPHKVGNKADDRKEQPHVKLGPTCIWSNFLKRNFDGGLQESRRRQDSLSTKPNSPGRTSSRERSSFSKS